MIDQLTFLMQQYPWLVDVLAVLMGLRLVFKPVFAFIGKYVELTVEQDDDKKLHKVMNTVWYKMLVFAVDYFASVKMPKVQRKK